MRGELLGPLRDYMSIQQLRGERERGDDSGVGVGFDESCGDGIMVRLVRGRPRWFFYWRVRGEVII